MALAIRMRFEPLRSIAYNAIVSGYMGVGTVLVYPASQFFIQNLTNATLMFSFDGVNNHFPLPAGGFFLSDIGSNQARNLGFFLSAGDRLYVKQSEVPTLGDVYFTVAYGFEG